MDNKPDAEIEILGGPLREFCPVRLSNRFIPYQHADLKGFAGNYVCDECNQVAPKGIYEPPTRKTYLALAGKWLCGACRDRLTPRMAQPEGLKNFQRLQ